MNVWFDPVIRAACAFVKSSPPTVVLAANVKPAARRSRSRAFTKPFRHKQANARLDSVIRATACASQPTVLFAANVKPAARRHVKISFPGLYGVLSSQGRVEFTTVSVLNDLVFGEIDSIFLCSPSPTSRSRSRSSTDRFLHKAASSS